MRSVNNFVQSIVKSNRVIGLVFPNETVKRLDIGYGKEKLKNSTIRLCAT